MDVNEDEFWAALRRSVREAERHERDELAEAERLLDEVDVHADPAERLDARRIDAMVGRVLAADAARERRAQAPVHRFPGLRRFLAAAAAVLVAPKFLAAAAVVTAVAVTTVVIRYSTHTLPFQEAIHILVDERQPEQARDSAQGTVALDVLESVGVLRGLTGEVPELAEHARSVLRGLRAELDGGRPFVRRSFGDSLPSLLATLADGDASVDARHEALSRAEALLGYGISALVEIARSSGPAALKRDNETLLRSLAGVLD